MNSQQAPETWRDGSSARLHVSLLTGGKDYHYALSLLSALLPRDLDIDFIANDTMQKFEITRHKRLRYFNLRGDQAADAPVFKKVRRVLRYYLRLMGYAFRSESSIFHILWQNRFEFFDNTLLILFYRLLGKKLFFTVHNVDIGQRDGHSSRLQRFGLRFLYSKVDHLFVHTTKMKDQLTRDFHTDPHKITVIPFAANNVTPSSNLTREQARHLLGFDRHEKLVLFFGNIAPYKGLDFLVEAMAELPDCRLIIAGKVKNCADYWEAIESQVSRLHLNGRIHFFQDYIPEEEVERFFKAADVLVLPYRQIFQSGVIFLSYKFGLPVIVNDVGSLREAVVEGETGLVSSPRDPKALAQTIGRYFASTLYRELEQRRSAIQAYLDKNHSWNSIGKTIVDKYQECLLTTLRGN